MRGICVGLVALSAVVSPRLAGADVVRTRSIEVTESARLQQRDPRTPRAEATVRIRGRVVDTVTGRPVRNATVRATSTVVRLVRSTASDEFGRYEFSSLPPGRYVVTAAKDGFTPASFGQTQPMGPGRSLDIPADETVEGVDLALVPGGVIAGAVMDEFGTPVPRVQVSALRRQFSQGRQRLVPTSRAVSTDDRGEFRLFGLAPGDYLVAATPANRGGLAQPDHPKGYARTFYPGTTSAADAQPVSVGVAETVAVTLSLAATRLSSVTGLVLGLDGAPMRSGVVSVRTADGSGVKTVPIKPDGTFLVLALAPGTYYLQTQDNRTLRTERPYVSAAVLEINEENVTNVVLAPVAMSAARGHVVVTPAAEPALARARIEVGVTPAAFDGVLGPQRPSVVNADRTFEFLAWPGRMFVRVLARDWVLTAVRVNGLDVTDLGVEFKNGEDVDDIELELTNHPPELSGLVTDEHGTAVQDYGVLVFPQDHRRRTNSDLILLARPDQGGRFVIRTLPPGAYYAVALDHVEQGEWADPEFLDRVQPIATAVWLRETASRVLQLELRAGS